jgi:hypothetical protein
MGVGPGEFPSSSSSCERERPSLARAVDDEAALTLAVGTIGNRLASVVAGALEKMVAIGSRVFVAALVGGAALALLILLVALVWGRLIAWPEFIEIKWLLRVIPAVGGLAIARLLLSCFLACAKQSMEESS